MTRNFLLTLTTALPLVITACGDSGGGTAGASTGGATEANTTSGTTTDTPTTTGVTTTGMSASGDSTTGDPATTDTPTTTGEPATTTGPDLTTTNDATATTTSDGDTGTGTGTGNDTGGDPVQQCLMMLPDPEDACGQCACNSCTMEFQTCQADPGCTAIFQCVQDSGCSGADCAGPCGGVIAMNGGFMGEPVNKAIALGTCVGNMCAMECGG